jgi:hypothetical protein
MACCAIVPGAASAATLSASPSNLASVFSSAQSGDTIQLAAGSYGSWQGGTKTGMVTLRPVSGAAVTLSTNFNGAAFITLDGLALGDTTIAGRSHDITIKNSAVTGPSVVDASTMSNANILFDHDSFDNIDACGTCYEGRLTVRGNNNTSAVGVAITNTHFGNGGGSDGVQIVGDAYGVQIGPGNEFANIKQGNYAAHVDSIQLYGSSHTQIVGNYFHDNDTIIMAPDGGNSEYIANNVMIGSGYVPAVQLGSHQNTQVVHNTVKNIQIQTGSKVGAPTGNNVNVSNNVFAQGASTSPAGGNGCTNCPVTYNLFVNSASGTNALTGTPVFAAGSAPTTYAGWALKAGSPGKGNASDGTDRGINLTAATSGGGTPGPPGGGGSGTTTTGGAPAGSGATTMVVSSIRAGSGAEYAIPGSVKKPVIQLRWTFRPARAVVGGRVVLSAFKSRERGRKCLWTVAKGVTRRGCEIAVHFRRPGLKRITLRITSRDGSVKRGTHTIRVVRRA